MKFFSTLSLTIIWVSAFSQIKIDSSFTLTGSVDTYFRSNLNSTNDATNEGTLAPATSFANLPGFSMGMFNLIGKYETAKSGFVADLVFGPRGRDAVFNSSGSLNIVNQAYAYYKPIDKWTLTLGKFNTFIGYEVISPVANYNYSTSYLFSYGPFNHAGLKANYDLGKGFGVMAGVFNQTDFTDFNPNGKFLAGGQLSYSGDKGAIYLNALSGQDFVQLDLTGTYSVTEKAKLGINGSIAKDLFAGGALYFNYSATDIFSLGVRGEYFIDEGLGILEEGEVLDLTLTSQISLGQLKLIPELRIDMFSSELVIPDGVKGTSSDNLSSFLVAAVYSF